MCVWNTIKINPSTIYLPLKDTPVGYNFLHLRTTKALMMKPHLHRTKQRPHGKKWGTSFCYHLTYKGSQLASCSRLKDFESKRLTVGTIFHHASMRFQDASSYYNSHIKNTHLKISFQNHAR